MQLELWTPETEQLKKMTDELMDQRMGSDWRTYFDPTMKMYRLKAILGWPRENLADGVRFLMTAGDLSLEKETGQDGAWRGTTTEELYRDAWGTALMDVGRRLIKAYVDEEMSIANRRYASISNVSGAPMTLNGPGLNGVPNEAMKELYETLEGWRIGIEINDSFVLIPDKSFGGWFEPVAIGEDRMKSKPCGGRGNCETCQLHCFMKYEDRKKGEIRLSENVLRTKKRTKDESAGYGVAFDLGTTTMAAMLWDLSSNEIRQNSTPLKATASPNPLGRYGADVISRIQYAGGDSKRLGEMQNLLVERMNQMIRELVESVENTEGQDQKPVVIRRIAAVGNPTMMHFLFGKDPSGLAKAPFRGEDLPLEVDVDSLGVEIRGHLEEGTKLRTLPVMGGHLGADAAAVMLASRLPECEAGTMAVDIGTNGEVILVDGTGQLWGCSAAAGPAFECGSIRPGSKLIDTVAAMLDQGWLDEEGLVSRYGLLSQQEIRQVQTGKGAIASGIELLAESAGLEKIKRILVAGTFGTKIRPESAVRIGLLPGNTTIESCGNLAGVGASLILLSEEEWTRGCDWAKNVNHVELADQPEFQETFLKHMDFPTPSR